MKKLLNSIDVSLNWIGNRLKTDVNYLVKSSFWLTFGQGLTSLSSFGLAIAFAHFVPKETYGTYKYIISISAIVSTFMLTGIGAAVVQAVARGYDATLHAAFKISMKWSVFMVVGSLAAAVYYFFQGNTILAVSLVVIGLITPFLKSFEIYDAYLGGKKQFKRSAAYNVIEDLGSALAIFITMFFTNNAAIFVLVFFATNVITKGFFYRLISKEIKANHLEEKVDYDAFNYSKHLSLINILLNISAQIDKIIVFHYLGAAELAIYSFARAMPQQIRAGLASLGSIVMPRFAARSTNEVIDGIPKKFFLSLLVLGPVVIAYIIAAPYIYKIFFPQYMDSVFYSQIYATFLLIMGNLSDTAITAKKAIKEKYILSIGMSLFSLILMLILVQFWGILGIILAIVITKFVNSIVSFILVVRLRDKLPE